MASTTLPTIIAEAGFSAGADTTGYLFLGDSVRGKLGTGMLAPATLLSDISADVQKLDTRRGASRADVVTRPEAGTASVALKDTGRNYDPTNLSGTYVLAGATQVVPMVVVVLRATWNGVTYSLFRGFADSWAISYTPKGNYQGVTLQSTDGFKVLQNINRAASGSVGAGEDSGARVSRILNSASWSADDRVIATGDTTLQATTLSGIVLDELLTVCDTEIAEMYVDGAGRFIYRNRNATLTDARSNTAQAVFGDGPGELPFSDITVEYDEQQVVNQARITRVGGAAQTAEDAASQAQYLVHTYENSSLLMQDDATALSWGRFIVHLGKDPELRFATLKVDPQRDPDNLYPQVLGREIGDRITINLRPDSGDAISRDCIIRGIEHNYDTAASTWLTTFTLQSASKWSFFVLGHATLGKLGSNALGF